LTYCIHTVHRYWACTATYCKKYSTFALKTFIGGWFVSSVLYFSHRPIKCALSSRFHSELLKVYLNCVWVYLGKLSAQKFQELRLDV
jgi:hypothetical protein